MGRLNKHSVIVSAIMYFFNINFSGKQGTVGAKIDQKFGIFIMILNMYT